MTNEPESAIETKHFGSKQPVFETSNRSLSHELGRESERISTAERASEASRAERANERADERGVQFLRPDD